MGNRGTIFTEIDVERSRQDKMWGHEEDDHHTVNDWVSFITMYAGKAVDVRNAPQDQRNYFLKVAALAVAALEAYERNGGYFPPRHYEITQYKKGE